MDRRCGVLRAWDRMAWASESTSLTTRGIARRLPERVPSNECLCSYTDVQDLENHCVARLQGIRRRGGGGTGARVGQHPPALGLSLGFPLWIWSGRNRDLKAPTARICCGCVCRNGSSFRARLCPGPPPGKGRGGPDAAGMMGSVSTRDQLFAADHVDLDFVADTLYVVGLGIRQSRSFGKRKNRWQVAMAAVVAKLNEFGGRLLPAAGSEPGRRHRSPGLGTAQPRFFRRPFRHFWPRGFT
jgi:hypothetical protein